MNSLFRTALGDDFEQLAPVLQRHYDLAPDQEVVVEGAMEAWNRFPWARALAAFMPIPAERVPVRVLNRGVMDAGQVCYEWQREFLYPGRTVTSYTLTRPDRAGQPARVLDTFNRPANIGLTLALTVRDAGRVLVQVTAGPQYLIRGGRYVPLPRLLHIYSLAEERALDDDRIYTEVTVSHPLFGRLFGYRGELRVSRGTPACAV
jgi:hypothetical protein